MLPVDLSEEQLQQFIELYENQTGNSLDVDTARALAGDLLVIVAAGLEAPNKT